MSTGLAVLVLLAGCDSAAEPTDAGSDVGADAGCTAPTELDLLFVIDDNASGEAEQSLLAAAIPDLVRAITTGDRDPAVDANGDGTANERGDDFEPPLSIHAAVISTDLGVGGFRIMGCEGNGDDGVLSRGTEMAACATVAPVLDVTETSASDLACRVQLGRTGCGFEMPLEAALKAITPTTCAESWCSYTTGTGHGDTDNAGFLRPDALLAIVILDDEDDCSAADAAIFNTLDPRYGGGVSFRCLVNREALLPVGRYKEAYLAGRAPERLLYTLIGGVPESLVSASYTDILAAPEMQVTLTPEGRPRASCSSAAGGNAFPPRRLVAVAQRLEEQGARAALASSCASDYGPAMDAVAAEIAAAFNACGRL